MYISARTEDYCHCQVMHISPNEKGSYGGGAAGVLGSAE